jgi:hypothetical protein
LGVESAASSTVEITVASFESALERVMFVPKDKAELVRDLQD